MNRTDIAYVINTTPKYFYLLNLHLTLLYRYAKGFQWPVFLATEAYKHPAIAHLRQAFPQLIVIPLLESQEGFLESRLAASKALPPSIQYIFPIQEDFLLERTPMWGAIEEAVQFFEDCSSVHSVRLMPCPGPVAQDTTFNDTEWRVLDYPQDTYLFTYQATLWRREAYDEYLSSVLQLIDKTFGAPLTPAQKVEIQIRMNIAEIAMGQNLLVRQGGLHLAWPRQGSQPNAVYLSPWPYRPTAVVRGQLEAWAEELAHREGVGLAPSLR